MFGKTIEDISIDMIRHDDRYYYVAEGYGGKPVHAWPIYRFYYMYIHESKEKAKINYEAWYVDQYKKYRFVEKRRGGMLGGSLDRLVTQKIRNGESDESLFMQAISERVDQRYALADTIINDGYIPRQSDPVEGIRKDKSIVLIRGHHRTAILAALGNDVVPLVHVYNNTRSYRLHRLVRRIGSLFP